MLVVVLRSSSTSTHNSKAGKPTVHRKCVFWNSETLAHCWGGGVPQGQDFFMSKQKPSRLCKQARVLGNRKMQIRNEAVLYLERLSAITKSHGIAPAATGTCGAPLLRGLRSLYPISQNARHQARW